EDGGLPLVTRVAQAAGEAQPAVEPGRRIGDLTIGRLRGIADRIILAETAGGRAEDELLAIERVEIQTRNGVGGQEDQRIPVIAQLPSRLAEIIEADGILQPLLERGAEDLELLAELVLLLVDTVG